MVFPSSDTYSYKDFDDGIEHLLGGFGHATGFGTNTQPLGHSVVPSYVQQQQRVLMPMDFVGGDENHDPLLAQLALSEHSTMPQQLTSLSHSDVVNELKSAMITDANNEPFTPLFDDTYNTKILDYPGFQDSAFQSAHQANSIMPNYVFDDSSAAFYCNPPEYATQFTPSAEATSQFQNLNVAIALDSPPTQHSSTPSPSSTSTSSTQSQHNFTSMASTLPSLDSSAYFPTISSSHSIPLSLSTHQPQPGPSSISLYTHAPIQPVIYSGQYYYATAGDEYAQFYPIQSSYSPSSDLTEFFKEEPKKPSGKKRGPKPKVKLEDEAAVVKPARRGRGRLYSRQPSPEIEIHDRSQMSIELAKQIVRDSNGLFICPVCQKLFNRQFVIKQHLLIHTGDKPFACTICKKAFSDRSNLRAHIKTHGESKSFLCTNCGKTFLLKSYLKKHETQSCTAIKGADLVQN